MKTMKKLLILAISLMILSGIQGMDKVQALENTEETEQQIPEGYTPIYDIAGLYAIRNNPSGNYILMNDIDMTEATKEGGEWDQGNGWTPIESFSGIFDGNGYRISGMCIYGTISTDRAGLFGELKGARVKNLGLIDVNINVSSKYVGGIAGYFSSSSIISSCYCSGLICNLYDPGRYTSYTGGIAGYGETYSGLFFVWKNYITNCSNAAEVSGQSYTSGILGYSRNGSGSDAGYSNYIQNCYNIANIVGGEDTTYAITVHWSSDSKALTNNYYLKDSAPKGTYNDRAGECVLLTETQMKNAKAYTGFDFETVWEIDSYCSYPYPQLKDNRMVRVSSVVLQKKPAKLVYNQGDKLDISDAELKITYEDGITTSIPVTTDMLSGYDMMEIGTQTVYVNYGGETTSFDIEVKEIPVESIEIPEKITIQRSKEQKLSLTILPENASDKSVEWESDNPSIASVDDAGLVKAISAGTTVITVTSANGLEAECEVTVQVSAIEIELNQTSLLLKKGESSTIMVRLIPLESTDEVKWKSSNLTVATVEDGMVEAKGAGTATITACTESGVEAKCEVTVQVPSISVQLDKTSLSLKQGEKGTLTVWVSPLDSTDTVKWKSSNLSVAEVTDGVVEAKEAGQATITAYTESGVEAKCEVTVQKTSTSSGGSTGNTNNNQNGNTPSGGSTGNTDNNQNGNTSPNGSNVNTDQNKNTAEINRVNAVKAKIKSAKNVKKTSIKLTLSGLSDCDGYQIQYSTSKKFKSVKKTTKKSNTVTVKKLKKGKTYYVRVRVYKRIDGTTYYGKWSNKKSVKIKK